MFPFSVKSLAPPFWKVFNQGFDNFLSASICVLILLFLFIRYRISLTVSKFSFPTCHGFVSVVQFQFFEIVPEVYLPILFMKFLYLYTIFQILVLISKRPLIVLEDIKKFGWFFCLFVCFFSFLSPNIISVFSGFLFSIYLSILFFFILMTIEYWFILKIQTSKS